MGALFRRVEAISLLGKELQSIYCSAVPSDRIGALQGLWGLNIDRCRCFSLPI